MVRECSALGVARIPEEQQRPMFGASVRGDNWTLSETPGPGYYNPRLPEVTKNVGFGGGIVGDWSRVQYAGEGFVPRGVLGPSLTVPQTTLKTTGGLISQSKKRDVFVTKEAKAVPGLFLPSSV